MNCCEPTSYFCTEIDDYRPTQTTLLTRFATIADCSDIWRTSNQDYGAFYYRNLPDALHCWSVEGENAPALRSFSELARLPGEMQPFVPHRSLIDGIPIRISFRRIATRQWELPIGNASLPIRTSNATNPIDDQISSVCLLVERTGW